MEGRRNSQAVIIGILAVALLIMSVGYAAAFNTTLNITGSTTAKAAKWDVHFDTASYSTTSGTVTPSAQNLTGTTASYTVTLTKPGDFYEFTVNVVNDGTFDANLTKITLGTPTTAQAKYIDYTVTYAGTEYTATTSGLSILLAAKNAGDTDTATVKVKVAYVQPTNAEDLPTEDQTMTLTAALDYVQAE